MANDAAVLAAVGQRLRALRERRAVTLADLSAETGISVSTLSRLFGPQCERTRLRATTSHRW
jgi:AraC-like DNA-binding protein